MHNRNTKNVTLKHFIANGAKKVSLGQANAPRNKQRNDSAAVRLMNAKFLAQVSYLGIYLRELFHLRDFLCPETPTNNTAQTAKNPQIDAQTAQTYKDTPKPPKSLKSPNFADSDAIQHYNTKTDTDAIAQRFYLQALARELMPEHRVAHCQRVIAPFKTTVDVKRNPTNAKTRYGNLIRCKSVWDCAYCASAISEHRRGELQRATQQHWANDGMVLHNIYTLRHNSGDHLGELLTQLRQAMRRFRNGKFWVNLRDDLGIVGYVTALEVTHGDNGWHPHLHELMFLRDLPAGERGELNDIFAARWARFVSKQGGQASLYAGFRMKVGRDVIADYVAKFGHLPQRGAWGVDAELTKQVVKQAKTDDGRTPMQLLYDYGDGDAQAGILWQEYSRVFHGRNQLFWSKGLKAHFGIGDLDDGAVTDADESDSSYAVLTTLSSYQWRVIRDGNWQALVLKVARYGDADRVHALVAALEKSPVMRVDKA